MSLYKIFRLGKCARNFNVPSPKTVQGYSSKQKYFKKHLSNGSKSKDESNSWTSFGLWKKWEWCVPVGVGVSLLAVLQWRHLKKYPYSPEIIEDGSVNSLMVKFYCMMPLRITSRIWGWIASIRLPVGIRPFIYKCYAKVFHANLDETDQDLSSFPSLVDFFVRPLKANCRPIANETPIVSPSDGKVLFFGQVESCKVEQVKGLTYNLKHFLGDAEGFHADETSADKFTPAECDAYVASLLRDPVKNRLYQLTVYLAPGDYHRFHSPADWRINLRRHFQGKLLSVNPKVASWLPDLFCLNERVVYIGEWAGGFMAYAAVGATNVGSIKVYCDTKLKTNTEKWPRGICWEDHNLDCTNIAKGQMFGEFRMGSTVVLLFEAPKDFEFSLNLGQQIKVGQAIARSSTMLNSNNNKNFHESSK